MTAPTKTDAPGLRIAVDYAPLVVFFLVNFLAPAEPMMRLVAAFSGILSDMDRLGAVVIARVICATAAFVIATVAAIVVSRVKLGHVSPMLWISGVLVVVFGGLTIYFHDPRFIQMKPTIVYATFAAVLAFGLATGKPLLQGLLGTAYPGLSALGWRKLTRNWALFFAAMAVLNELVWRNTGWNFWVGFKLWGAIPLTLGFAVANLPMLLRHGLQAEGGDAVTKELPPE
ncbi:inner membrane-spanning protein YciB [Sphingomonas sp. KR1UV-12]|uniref:Inner membrane-spanning protein YciB n=1 Tax=Sphingomonas aurea TaxID=3063994 RepID=A0ABT9EGY8_9SPHN|nr:inner membrane-spanning protein YciB [Sphingomonas sp. KR1UV-12]MDP1026041.1 inner membrane-spanning protein YciB [Sphingomonas sp. KR1UV-12]